MYGSIMPAAGISAFATLTIIVLVMMYGRATSNPKLSEWSKTEIVQLPITIASVIVLVLVMESFCAIDMDSVRSLFGKAPLGPPTIYSGSDAPAYSNVFNSAESYLMQAANFSRHAMVVVRYHHSVYNILLMRSSYYCDWWCIFGQSGTTIQGFAGYAGRLNMMGLFLNTDITSYLSALNSLFIFLFVKKGFLVALLPMGIFLRSMPFLRTFGSVFIALAMSFFLIYPGILAVFSMLDGMFTSPFSGMDVCSHTDLDAYFQDESNVWSRDHPTPLLNHGELLHDDELMKAYFPCGQDYPIQAAQYSAYAFIAAIFLPMVALLGAAASVRYIAKMYGEEIDLSRIVQMV